MSKTFTVFHIWRNWLNRTRRIRWDFFSIVDFCGLCVIAFWHIAKSDTATFEIYSVKMFAQMFVFVMLRLFITGVIYLCGFVMTFAIGKIQQLIMLKFRDVQDMNPNQYDRPAYRTYPVRYIDQQRRRWYVENYEELGDRVSIIVFFLALIAGLIWSMLYNFDMPWHEAWYGMFLSIFFMITALLYIIQMFSCVIIHLIGLYQRAMDLAWDLYDRIAVATD